jgi:cyclic pyranopterin phosphate synthase
VEKIRLTGGEPLVRREVERLVEMLARIPRLGDLAMTTNGSALARKARALGDEYMDVGHSNGWRMDEVVPAAEIVAMIGAEMPLEPVAPNYPGEVVERWRYGDGSGEIGVIASVTRPFCGGCTRARLSAEGKLFTCLFAVAGHDLRALLRGGASDAEISAAIGGIWWMREDRYSELRTAATAGLPKVEMSYIGG